MAGSHTGASLDDGNPGKFQITLIHWTTSREDPVASEGAEFSHAMVRAAEGVELLVLRWLPGRGAGRRAPLVFVAGWVSAVEGWADVLRVIARDRPVYYVESREKSSARISTRRLGPDDFSVHRMALDLKAVCIELGLDDGRVVLMGSSLGASSIIESLKEGGLEAQSAFVVGPNSHFTFPWWGKVLISLPAFTYHISKWVAIFYLKHFKVDSRREPEQMERYLRTLRIADPLRMKLSAQAVQSYRIWPGLASIEAPVAVAFAHSDTLHREEDIKRIVEEIPRGRLVSCPSNRYMHTAPIAGDLDRFVHAAPAEPLEEAAAHG